MCYKCPYSKVHIRFNISIKIPCFLFRNICRESFMSLNFTIFQDLLFLSWLQDCIFLLPNSIPVYWIHYLWTLTTCVLGICDVLSFIIKNSFHKLLNNALEDNVCLQHFEVYQQIFHFICPCKYWRSQIGLSSQRSCTNSCLLSLLSTNSVCVLVILTTRFINNKQ